MGRAVAPAFPPGGAKAGSPLATLRACKALITQFRTAAVVLLAFQKQRKTQGLSHQTLAQCEPLIATIASGAVRHELTNYLPYQLRTATTLGLDHIGLPISSDPIESLCGVATHHGVGERQKAGRMALRLPAVCGAPTRQEAQQVLEVSVAQQQALTAHVTSLIQQRRMVCSTPDARERLGMDHVSYPLEIIPRAKNRSNNRAAINLSKNSKETSDAARHRQNALHCPESAVS